MPGTRGPTARMPVWSNDAMDDLKRLSAFLNGFIPSSTLVCSVDGDPPEGGGTPAPQTPPAPATPAAPQFSPEQLAWIESERTAARNAGAAAARRAEQERQGRRGGDTPAQPSTPTTPQPSGGADPAQVYMRLRTFDRAVDKYDLPGEAREILEADFNTASPSDPADWVSRRAAAFGWKARGATATTPATPAPATPAPQAHSSPPVTGAGAPATPTTVTDDTPILRLSNEARESLRRRIGDAAYVDRMRKEFRTVRVRG